MSMNIIDGFEKYSGRNNKAILFFEDLAVFSYNTGLKYVVMVVTHVVMYANDILKCNGGGKFHRVYVHN